MNRKTQNTVALLARFPTFRDWVVKNLTAAQLDAVCRAPRGTLSFGADHPLSDQKFAAGVFRAYRSDVIAQIRYEFSSFAMFLAARGQGATTDETYQNSVVWAIVFMTQEYPEVYQEALDAGEAVSDDDPIDDF